MNRTNERETHLIPFRRNRARVGHVVIILHPCRVPIVPPTELRQPILCRPSPMRAIDHRQHDLAPYRTHRRHPRCLVPLDTRRPKAPPGGGRVVPVHVEDVDEALLAGLVRARGEPARAFLLDAHDHSLGGVRGKEGIDFAEDVVEGGVLVDGAVVHDEGVAGVDAQADVDHANAGVELRGESLGGCAEVFCGGVCVSDSVGREWLGGYLGTR